MVTLMLRAEESIKEGHDLCDRTAGKTGSKDVRSAADQLYRKLHLRSTRHLHIHMADQTQLISIQLHRRQTAPTMGDLYKSG